MPVPFSMLALIGEDRHRDTEKRCDGAFAEERLVSLIFRMSNKRHRQQQLRTSRRDDE
jgi:hypothetical protein